MSGTNTICVVDGAARDRHGRRMIEPVHRAHARSARGADPRATPRCEDGKVKQVTFRNVPAFATHLERR